MTKRTEKLAENLRTLREVRGKMGQRELAETVGISRRTVARLEAADVADPGVNQLTAIASALGVPLTHMIDRKLVSITVPLPVEVQETLAGEAGAELLEVMVRAADAHLAKK